MCFLMRACEKSDDFGDAICESVSHMKVRMLKGEKLTGSIWRLPGTETSLPCSYPVPKWPFRDKSSLPYTTPGQVLPYTHPNHSRVGATLQLPYTTQHQPTR